MLVALKVIAIASAIAQGGGQFNLTCVGPKKVIDLSLVAEETTQERMVLRLDLDAKKWCTADCQQTMPIAEVTNTAIVLQKSVLTPGPGQMFMINEVNRTSGRYIRSSRFKGLSINYDGACEKTPFTGFPVVSTKF